MIVNKKQLANIFGVTVTTIGKWQEMPGFPASKTGGRGSGNEYDTATVVAWFVAYKMGEHVGTDGPLVLETERARLAAAQADLTELKAQQLRGELAPIALMTAVLAKAGGQVAAILESIPVKVKRRMPELNAAAITVLTDEIAKSQNTVADLGTGLDDFLETEQAESL